MDHYCLDADGGIYNPPVRVRKAGDGAHDGEVEPLRRLPVSARRVIPQLGPVHYLDPNMYRAFDTAGFGVLARLLDVYREDFQLAENVYKYETDSGPAEMGSYEAFERTTARLREVLMTPKLTEIEGTLSRNLGALLGPEAQGALIEVALPSAEDLLADALRLRVQDDTDSPVVPIDQLGSGYRSILRLAILRTYAELQSDERKAVFLVEEPEAYLNPHLRRHLRAVLEDLAAAGHDVFLTTHDPAFAPLTDYGSVLRLEKRRGSTAWFRCIESLDFSYEAVAQKLRRGGNAECLFASKVVLCEGQDDVAAVRHLLETREVDLDARSVSVLDCGGRENLPDYVALLDALEVELLVVSDGDATKAAENPGVAQHVAAVKKAAGDRLYLFSEDLEDALGIEKASRANAAQVLAVVEEITSGARASSKEINDLGDRLTAFVGTTEAHPVAEASDAATD